MSEYTATIKLKADRSGLTGELKIAQADIAKLNDELQQTGAAGAKGAEGVKKHGTEARGAARESEKLSKETKTLREQYLSLKNVLVGYGVLQIGRFFKDQLAVYQDTRTMLQGLTGSTQEYNETQAYLVDISERYSKQLNTVSGSYARLLALQNADLVTKKEARQLTEGLLNAGAALKANNEQLGLVYYGLAQGLSQVNLQAQELNQVMEPLPGLLVHMDDAAGLTSGGFRRMVMDGQVTSEFFKTTLIEALQVYEGAAEATYNNISSIQDRLATGHTLLAASLEGPINMSIGSLLRGYVVGVETLAKVMPTLIELIKDLVTVTALLVGVKVAAWFTGIAAGSWAAIAGLFTLEARLYAGLRATSAYTVALTGLKGAMAFLGGPLGIAVLAGAALLTFGINSTEAAMRATNLRSEIDQLAESFNELTVSQLDQQIQSQMLAMEELAKQKAALGEKPVPMTGSGNSNLGSVPNMASLNELRDWQTESATIIDELDAGVAKLNALAIARGNAVTASLNAEALATEALTKTQQDLLDKYLPLETLTAEYTKNLAALNAIEVDSVATAARKQRAIDALNAVYEDQVKELTGVLAAEDAASKAAEKTLQDMLRLIDQYAPLQNAVAEYETQLLTLTLAYETGRLSLENYHLAVAALAEEKLEAFQPGAALVRQMEAELKLMRMSAADQEFAKRTRHLTTLEIEEQGDAIQALIGTMSDEQAAIDALDARQQDYARTTQNMLEDLQRSWNSYFDQVLEKGKLNMRSLGDSILAVMRQTIAGVMSMDLANAFRSTLNVTAPTATSAGSTSVNWQSVGTLMGAGVAGVLNASIAQTVAPLYEGGQLISEGAKTLNFDLKNIGTNLLAGLAGGTIGTALGEAVFGKQAQSNYGAMAGAAIGSMLPGVGTFLGSLIGGGLDALFGGDGYQRSSVGFDTGRDMVKSQYYYGTETFSSGLQVNKINRRGDQAVSDAITAKFAEIDAFVFSAARGAGATLDMRNKQLQGTHADYGWDNGSFFGLRAGEGADAEEALNGLFTSFSRQLINHIEGLSADVTRAMQQATGDADELLAQLKDALALDSLLRSGQLDVLGDVSFDFAQQLAEAAGGIENLSMVTQLFNTSVAEQSDSMQNMVTRLRTAVSDQFAAMNLALNDFTSMSQFREYFESVKQTMDAVQLLDLLQAGNALALLIEQEKELALVRQQAMNEQIAAVKTLVDQYQWIRTQSQAVAGAL
ncbi:MAG: tape measure protein, partial [Pseudohongiella sp.]|nr:tape measure protein [Pseudohongiella sp.]